VTAASLEDTDPNAADLPSQPPSAKTLRRPLESTQYLALRYTERLAGAGIEPSVGSVGDSYDNALAETINGLFKAEVIHRRGPWRSFEAVEYATLEWVDWYNHRRLLAPIGNVPPAEAEARYHANVGDQALAA
jgi:transposase InsO family protein